METCVVCLGGGDHGGGRPCGFPSSSRCRRPQPLSFSPTMGCRRPWRGAPPICFKSSTLQGDSRGISASFAPALGVVRGWELLDHERPKMVSMATDAPSLDDEAWPPGGEPPADLLRPSQPLLRPRSCGVSLDARLSQEDHEAVLAHTRLCLHSIQGRWTTSVLVIFWFNHYSTNLLLTKENHVSIW